VPTSPAQAPDPVAGSGQSHKPIADLTVGQALAGQADDLALLGS
jgi:hypothetical protein